MQVTLEIPEYDPSKGFTFQWEEGFSIQTSIEGSVILMRANKEGLLSLANHLLNLAQDDVPPSTHLHLDEWNSLEGSSSEMIIEKI